jgi:hypothetical protein
MEKGQVQMLESTVDLVGGLFLTALALLIGSCIVGSIVAALRAVDRGTVQSVRGGEEGLRFRG